MLTAGRRKPGVCQAALAQENDQGHVTYGGPGGRLFNLGVVTPFIRMR